MTYIKSATIIIVLFVTSHMLMASACSVTRRGSVQGFDVKVAKVDVEYIYEGNIVGHMDYVKSSRRSTVSIFVGYSPDRTLSDREYAIDNEIRNQIKRFPGVTVINSAVEALANEKAEQIANEVYYKLTADGEDFADLAMQYSDGDYASKGGLMDAFDEVTHPEYYQSLTYDMEVGDLTGPIESPTGGWRIFRLEEKVVPEFGTPQYTVRMILIRPNTREAEDELIDAYASNYTIEILDPKYNSHAAYLHGKYDYALSEAERAIQMNNEDDLAHYLRSRILWELGRKQDAVDAMLDAAETGRISDKRISYYHFFRGQWLEEMGEIDAALEAYHETYNTFQQTIDIARGLQLVFERLEDEEYLDMILEEIDIMAEQDRFVVAMNTSTATRGVIITGDGRTERPFQEYIPKYMGAY